MRRTFAALGLVLCLVLAGGARAQSAPDVPSGTYQLDPRHASVLFRIQHQGLAWFTARFDIKDATLDLDAADPTRSRLTASVDAGSVNTGVLNRDNERAFDAQIGRALGGEANPRITFESRTVELTGERSARVSGDLTMNGQTHPAALDVTFGGATGDLLRGGRTVLGFSARGVIRRSDWGVTQWRAFTGDEVEIVIEAEFVKT
ncbi:MAG: YceI family protein [Hyphomonadaceae bacterium]